MFPASIRTKSSEFGVGGRPRFPRGDELETLSWVPHVRPVWANVKSPVAPVKPFRLQLPTASGSQASLELLPFNPSF